MIRKAKLSDANAIYDLINFWAKNGKVLPRPLNYIFEHLRDFWVYVKDKRIVGCCALNVVGWQNLAEIKSLVVAKAYHGKGLGRQLVEVCLKEAAEIGVEAVFALTYASAFFKKLGFKTIDRKKLPHKIWNDCINCPDFPDCAETAMILSLKKRGLRQHTREG